ncbi:uncharacterized protein L969DRAFT_19642 [Mixia osmundae IAM 14324]|uniref:Vacuolar ATPase assembly protein VMA22 n=1 Tax=Mixia osmundae (strain CBS 9802 / IAM 14324 / JCM 22182 / KY 12970) TaxID=764103 RepID=G7DSX7_MIXOS|nr:uncharacterized protein L969DRAFT_19642 [Mixia osmundae IAM 14324]KEI37101.1 hypothetical protein L969DRAFT_19642 [Mixia osmundae IAM 14324]GAA93687.1 hypothetical protein E5Q_00332 [Mixia osmundae IAM 14324]
MAARMARRPTLLSRLSSSSILSFSARTGPTPIEKELRDLLVQLDNLLAQLLSALSDYEQARLRLAKQFRTGFFDLARAKRSLGTSRVSPASYNMASSAPLRTVLVEQHDRVSICVSTSAKALMGAVSAPSSPEQVEKTRRTRTRSASAASASSSTSSLTEDEEPRVIEDPIMQFSALPPMSLREAQAGFVRGTEAVSDVLNAQIAITRLEHQIDQLRRTIDALKRDRPELGPAS